MTLEVAPRPALTAESFADAGETNELDVAPRRPLASRPLVVLAWLASLGAIYVARGVIIPVALAVLLALLLRPILRRLRRLHVPDILSAFVSVAIVAALFGMAMLTVARQGQRWLAEAPQTVERVRNMLPRGKGPLGNLRVAAEAVQGLAQPEAAQTPVPVEVQSSAAAYSLIGAGGHFVSAAVIVFVLAFFFLAFSDTLLKQAVESRPSFAEKRNVVELVQNVESGISRYLATITIINLGLGIVTALTLWQLGVPNPVLWGVLATTLNYVPHVGAFLCMAILFFVGAVAHQSLWSGAGVAGAFAVITSIESYLVTPLVLSKSLQLSPLAVILAVLFWGWLWGIPGALMAAPLLTVIKIMCDQFEPLAALGVVLGGKTANDGISRCRAAA
jgi:predicted PurR-regulated permease PerM